MSDVDYEHRTLDPHDDSAGNLAALDAWLRVVSQGFHDARPGEQNLEVGRDTLRREDARTAGAWLPEGEFGAGPGPVATFSSFTKTMNAGAEILPLHMITDVTVSPAHRRRGLLRRMMVEDLESATAPVAALTVSEGGIYGRFGFAPAVFRRRIEVDTTSRFALREISDPGRVELIDPHVSWDLLDGLFQRFHSQTRGSIARPAFYEKFLPGLLDFGSSGPDQKLRGAVHLDGSGEPDGYALYKIADGEQGRPKPVDANLLALDATAELALWRFLAGIDLTGIVRVRDARVDDVLDWSVSDPQAVRVTGVNEHIWVRILDVPAALAARPWYAEDALTLHVTDPLGFAEGTFSVAAADGRASVTTSEGGGDVTLDVETLSALYLGGVRVDTLRRAGRVAGEDDAVRRLAAMLDGGPTPYCLTSF